MPATLSARCICGAPRRPPPCSATPSPTSSRPRSWDDRYRPLGPPQTPGDRLRPRDPVGGVGIGILVAVLAFERGVIRRTLPLDLDLRLGPVAREVTGFLGTPDADVVATARRQRRLVRDRQHPRSLEFRYLAPRHAAADAAAGDRCHDLVRLVDG